MKLAYIYSNLKDPSRISGRDRNEIMEGFFSRDFFKAELPALASSCPKELTFPPPPKFPVRLVTPNGSPAELKVANDLTNKNELARFNVEKKAYQSTQLNYVMKALSCALAFQDDTLAIALAAAAGQINDNGEILLPGFSAEKFSNSDAPWGVVGNKAIIVLASKDLTPDQIAYITLHEMIHSTASNGIGFFASLQTVDARGSPLDVIGCSALNEGTTELITRIVATELGWSVEAKAPRFLLDPKDGKFIQTYDYPLRFTYDVANVFGLRSLLMAYFGTEPAADFMMKISTYYGSTTLDNLDVIGISSSNPTNSKWVIENVDYFNEIAVRLTAKGTLKWGLPNALPVLQISLSEFLTEEHIADQV